MDCHSGACSEWRQGGARITVVYDFCVGRTLPVTIVITMLAPSGDRAVPALFDLLYDHHDACSEWRQGGARITVVYDFCVGRTLPVTIVITMLAPSGDRAVPALFDLLCGHHDACSKWRQGGTRITVLSDLCTNDITSYGAVG